MVARVLPACHTWVMNTATAELVRNIPYNRRHSDWWLVIDNTVVAYARTYHDDWQGGTEKLCDVETREEYRNQGYAKKILAMIAEEVGVKRVYHSGSYTPDGFNFLYSTGIIGDQPTPVNGPTCNPMTFVRDWDEMIPKFN